MAAEGPVELLPAKPMATLSIPVTWVLAATIPTHPVAPEAGP